jgi:hypothetical protein
MPVILHTAPDNAPARRVSPGTRRARPGAVHRGAGSAWRSGGRIALAGDKRRKVLRPGRSTGEVSWRTVGPAPARQAARRVWVALCAGAMRGWRASRGPRWSMTCPAADFEIPNNGPSCRIVKLVRQYAATSRTRSSRGRPQGRPLRAGSAPSRRSAVTSLRKLRRLSPVNGPIQDGCDALITPATRR